MKISLQEVISELAEKLAREDIEEIRSFLISAIQRFREELKFHRDRYTEQENNTHYGAAVSLRGILDYVNLQDLTSRPNWEQNPKDLEAIWTRLWDCKERMESHPQGLGGPFIEEIKGFISHLGDFYHAKLGPGMYMSPDIKVNLRLCTICNENIKKCSHVPGRLYNGQMCRSLLRDVEARSVSIVTNPRDPRCRIWPWNMKNKKQTCWVTVLSLFCVDDFLQEEDWPKAGTKWPEGISSQKEN